MTTLDPGASVVFTQGLLASPASTAFLASSAAPTITDGLEVLVQDVIAAITTEPWSMVTLVPSSRVTPVGVDTSVVSAEAGGGPASSSALSWVSVAIGSEAGNVSATPLSVSGTET